ncbi:Hypothetical predicted protein [Octopus vulgaris]|uniref:Uncharacterized protein n=1 Tax=Octopus vulgaris TaxID=6645 RepID=A0AA36BUA7_OCTVU|nr:Hypothetical predicted protein [Octopus vulgaris]
MAQTDAFMERMDKRRQGLWAYQRELEFADGSALEDRCWTGDSDGPVGRDCPSNEASSETDSEGSVAEPGLVAEICDAGPVVFVETEAYVAEPDVKETEKPVEGVMADAVVPCLEPLASRPLSLGAQDEELARSGVDVAESEGFHWCYISHITTAFSNSLPTVSAAIRSSTKCKTFSKYRIQRLILKYMRGGLY